jgi:ATP-dependent Clp protease protease subunit
LQKHYISATVIASAFREGGKVMSQGHRLVIPYMIEQSPSGERTMDIYSRLLNDRIVFLGAPIDEQGANAVMAQLLHLDAEDPERDINLYINSPGGSVHAGMAIYDTMQFVDCDVATTALGMVASMAVVLLAAGTKGKRYALPNAKIVLHQPHIEQGLGGQVSDVEIHARELVQTKRRMNQVLAERTGQPFEKIDRDYVLEANEAVEYGVIDRVVDRAGVIGGEATGENA